METDEEPRASCSWKADLDEILQEVKQNYQDRISQIRNKKRPKKPYSRGGTKGSKKPSKDDECDFVELDRILENQYPESSKFSSPWLVAERFNDLLVALKTEAYSNPQKQTLVKEIDTIRKNFIKIFDAFMQKNGFCCGQVWGEDCIKRICPCGPMQGSQILHIEGGLSKDGTFNNAVSVFCNNCVGDKTGLRETHRHDWISVPRFECSSCRQENHVRCRGNPTSTICSKCQILPFRVGTPGTSDDSLEEVITEKLEEASKKLQKYSANKFFAKNLMTKLDAMEIPPFLLNAIEFVKNLRSSQKLKPDPHLKNLCKSSNFIAKIYGLFYGSPNGDVLLGLAFMEEFPADSGMNQSRSLLEVVAFPSPTSGIEDGIKQKIMMEFFVELIRHQKNLFKFVHLRMPFFHVEIKVPNSIAKYSAEFFKIFIGELGKFNLRNTSLNISLEEEKIASLFQIPCFQKDFKFEEILFVLHELGFPLNDKKPSIKSYLTLDGATKNYINQLKEEYVVGPNKIDAENMQISKPSEVGASLMIQSAAELIHVAKELQLGFRDTKNAVFSTFKILNLNVTVESESKLPLEASKIGSPNPEKFINVKKAPILLAKCPSQPSSSSPEATSSSIASTIIIDPHSPQRGEHENSNTTSTSISSEGAPSLSPEPEMEFADDHSDSEMSDSEAPPMLDKKMPKNIEMPRLSNFDEDISQNSKTEASKSSKIVKTEKPKNQSKLHNGISSSFQNTTNMQISSNSFFSQENEEIQIPSNSKVKIITSFNGISSDSDNEISMFCENVKIDNNIPESQISSKFLDAEKDDEILSISENHLSKRQSEEDQLQIPSNSKISILSSNAVGVDFEIPKSETPKVSPNSESPILSSFENQEIRISSSTTNSLKIPPPMEVCSEPSESEDKISYDSDVSVENISKPISIRDERLSESDEDDDEECGMKVKILSESDDSENENEGDENVGYRRINTFFGRQNCNVVSTDLNSVFKLNEITPSLPSEANESLLESDSNVQISKDVTESDQNGTGEIASFSKLFPESNIPQMPTEGNTPKLIDGTFEFQHQHDEFCQCNANVELQNAETIPSTPKSYFDVCDAILPAAFNIESSKLLPSSKRVRYRFSDYESESESDASEDYKMDDDFMEVEDSNVAIPDFVAKYLPSIPIPASFDPSKLIENDETPKMEEPLGALFDRGYEFAKFLRSSKKSTPFQITKESSKKIVAEFWSFNSSHGIPSNADGFAEDIPMPFDDGDVPSKK